MIRFGARAAAIASLVVAIAMVHAPVGGAASVGPNQRFAGLVNGNHRGAVVYVACAGPVWPGRTGPATGGQYVAALRLPSSASAGGGETAGSATHIVVRFANAPGMPVSLTTYGVAKSLPSGLELPCSGTGKVSFTPVPKDASAVVDRIDVTYENIAE